MDIFCVFSKEGQEGFFGVAFGVFAGAVEQEVVVEEGEYLGGRRRGARGAVGQVGEVVEEVDEEEFGSELVGERGASFEFEFFAV